MMTPDGIRGMCVASDAASQRVDELQFVLGEGPCIDAFDNRRPVLVSDLDANMTRWPLYAPSAARDGVRAVFAFPLQVGGARLGILDVFRGGKGPLSNAELTDALLFTDVTVSAVLDRQEGSGDRNRASDDLADAVERRAEIFQAQGMVMVQLGLSLSDALARMRAHAYAHSRPLSEVAQDVIHQRLTFTPEMP